MSTKHYEDHVRTYEDEKRAYDAACREWMAKQGPAPTTLEEVKALEYRFVMEHRKETDALSALASEVNVAKAALERRWIEAHEDLAVLRKAGILQ